jgi:hypothetical protein
MSGLRCRSPGSMGGDPVRTRKATEVPDSIVDIQVLPDKIVLFIRCGEVSSEVFLQALQEHGVVTIAEEFRSPCG